MSGGVAWTKVSMSFCMSQSSLTGCIDAEATTPLDRTAMTSPMAIRPAPVLLIPSPRIGRLTRLAAPVRERDEAVSEGIAIGEVRLRP